jgi:hypothetical protein
MIITSLEKQGHAPLFWNNFTQSQGQPDFYILNGETKFLAQVLIVGVEKLHISSLHRNPENIHNSSAEKIDKKKIELFENKIDKKKIDNLNMHP